MTTINEQSVLTKIDELPVISPAAFEMLGVLDNDATALRSRVVYLVSIDQVLCATVFKFVNSAASGFGKEVATLEEAIDIIGLNQLKTLAFSIAVRKIFTDDEHWCDSLFTAVLASELATQLEKPDVYVSALYLAGLMYSSGVLIFRTFFKEEFAHICKERSLIKKLKLERETFGFDQVGMAVEVLNHWKIPSEIVKTIGACHKPESEFYSERVAILSLATEILCELDYLKKQKDDFLLKEILDQRKYMSFGLAKLKLSMSFIEECSKKAEKYQKIFG